MAATYCQTHQLGATIEKALTEALGSQPENPFAALAAWFAAGGAATVTTAAPKKKAAPEPEPEPEPQPAAAKPKRPSAADVLEALFGGAPSADFFFVQIGANVGDTPQDPLFRSIVKYGWRGLLVEPLTHAMAQLRANCNQNQAPPTHKKPEVDLTGCLWVQTPAARGCSLIRVLSPTPLATAPYTSLV